MKLGDLARISGDNKSFVSALWAIRSRFQNQETAGKTAEKTGQTATVSRRSYESVPRSSSAPHLLTLLQ